MEVPQPSQSPSFMTKLIEDIVNVAFVFQLDHSIIIVT